MPPAVCSCCSHWTWSPDVYDQIMKVRNERTTARNGCLVVSVGDISAVDRHLVESIIRLYLSYFKRAPDETGLSFWVRSHKDARQGGTMTLAQISQFFADSAEFKTRYGSTSNGQFVDLVYRNVLERAPDAMGRAYWLNRLNTKQITRGECLLFFSDSPEYKAKTAQQVSQIKSPKGATTEAHYFEAQNNPVSHDDPLESSSSTSTITTSTTTSIVNAPASTTPVDSSSTQPTLSNDQTPTLSSTDDVTTITDTPLQQSHASTLMMNFVFLLLGSSVSMSF